MLLRQAAPLAARFARTLTPRAPFTHSLPKASPLHCRAMATAPPFKLRQPTMVDMVVVDHRNTLALLDQFDQVVGQGAKHKLAGPRQRGTQRGAACLCPAAGPLTLASPTRQQHSRLACCVHPQAAQREDKQAMDSLVEGITLEIMLHSHVGTALCAVRCACCHPLL